jgi:hypothetical protein
MSPREAGWICREQGPMARSPLGIGMAADTSPHRRAGPAVKELITIVSPRTVAHWASSEGVTKRAKPSRSGRPRVKEDIRELVLRLARETGWGYTRILGELKRLEAGKVCRSTVVNVLRENGLDPGPKRGEDSWDEFVRRHAKTLWACDFFSKKVWTRAGLVDVFVLFFLYVGSRRVHLAGMTARPGRAWVVQQARNFLMTVGGPPTSPRSFSGTTTPSLCPSSTPSLRPRGAGAGGGAAGAEPQRLRRALGAVG